MGPSRYGMESKTFSQLSLRMDRRRNGWLANSLFRGPVGVNATPRTIILVAFEALSTDF